MADITSTDWVKVRDRLPPNDEVVETKIHDHRGCRNEVQLRRLGRLWFTPDMRMYVYYAPTHWKPVS